MKNYIGPGKTITYTNTGSAIDSGDVVSLPFGIGIAAGDIGATTGVGEVSVEGVYELAKDSGVFAVGDLLYWSGTALTKTAAQNKLAGFCTKAAGSGVTVGEVKLVAGADSDIGNLSTAANVAPLGATSNLVGVDGAGSNAAPLAGTETRLDNIEAKVDAVIAALIAANLMAAGS